MKVSKSSWHYWLYKNSFEHFGHAYEPSNLCPYFWRVVWGGFKVLMVATVFTVILGFVGWLFYTHTAATFGAVVAIGAIIAVCANWNEIQWQYEKRFGNEDEEAPPPEPGLIRSYIKAKKDKVCPPLRVVE